MDLQIALLLGQDGIVNGAIYGLLAVALVLVFSVTRVIFIPQGEFVSFGALTLAMIAAVFAVMGARLGRDTGSALLAAMLAIKPAELRSLRDARSLVGFALFAHDILGAGDAKLAGALTLWLDPAQVPAFMLICAGIAGLLTLGATLAARAPAAAALRRAALVADPGIGPPGADPGAPGRSARHRSGLGRTEAAGSAAARPRRRPAGRAVLRS